MDFILGNIFSLRTFIYLAGLIIATLISARIGVKELRRGHSDGSMYIVLSLFFLSTHAVFLFTGRPENTLFSYATQLDILSWFIIMLAPAMIVLYLIYGLFSLFQMKITSGLVKLILAAVLIGFLYFFGREWEFIKAGITVALCATWFLIEIRTANNLR